MKKRRMIRRCSMPEITLTPLIDTALTLLVIFMVAAPMMHHSIKVNLPQGSSKDIKEPQPKQVMVHILSNGTLVVNEKPVERGKLLDEIKAVLSSDANSKVYVYGDSAISYGTLIDVFDSLKNGSINSVVLALRPPTKL